MLEILNVFFENLGIKREVQKVFFRFIWVLVVTAHMLWVSGFLVGIGFAAPFAKASDVDKLLRAQEISTRLAVQNEIRVQTRVYCENMDSDIRASAMRRIDELRDQMWEISKVRPPDPQCLRGPGA